VTQQFWASDAIYREWTGWPEPRVYEGSRAALARMRRLLDLVGPLKVQLDNVIEAEDGRIVACVHIVGEATAEAPSTQSFAVVHRLWEGLIVEADYYLDPARGLRAVGLSER
jgi:ketosteroid isomerase-like protein